MVSRKSTRFVSRRKFASAFGGAVLAGFAGCSGGGGGGGSEGGSNGGGGATPTETTEPTATATAEPTATATTTPTTEADTTIEVGPDGNYLGFSPERVRISKGDTVKWVFKSSGHNVSGRPGDSPKIEIPDAAEPFSSYEKGNSQTVDSPGSTFTHTFETKGDYTYVCILHAHNGMIGHLTVR